ncbi:usherin-like [Plakobranchus ocellatus]|uniref:Usherin-like n=1 Tax=Plakobranchus ocellatus TaxID=259542 RepID=A0AAV4E1M9_9GAST|nr:usherin-like [Plakobranchus ocellatus]
MPFSTLSRVFTTRSPVHFINHLITSSHSKASLFLLHILILVLIPGYSKGQLPSSQRAFPPLFNAARAKPVLTNPSASTCGLGRTTAFCVSSVQVESINNCVQDFCVQTCPGRSQLPLATNLLEATSPGSGDCVVADIVNIRPGSGDGAFSWTLTRAGPTCFLQPRASPRLDSSGVVSFTLTVWIWLNSQETG